jgi:iron complex transport system substrate-binding protein
MLKHSSWQLLIIIGILLTVIPTHSQSSAFPVTIEHQYGSTVIDETPLRVVSIGYTEQDVLLALGIMPVAVRYWYGEEDAIQPWAEDKVTGEKPIVLNMPYGTLNYEAILALEPDLISAVTAGITQEEYDLLSQIAPTLTQTADYINFGMPWQEVTKMIGAAVGKRIEAEALVTEVETLFADARANNPQFDGKTIAVSYNYNGGTYGFYTEQDARGRFFTELGFVVPQEMVEAAGELFYADLSTERIDLLDQDLIAIVNLQFIEGGRETLEADPLFNQLQAVQDGRVLYFDEIVENAVSFSSPLSLAFALEATVPQLETIFPADAQAQGNTNCEAGFRLFEHQFLATEPVCIPEAPQRIVVADFAALDVMYTLDIPAVGYGSLLVFGWYTNMVPELMPSITEYLSSASDVGGIPLNFEALLATNPDLILVNGLLVPDEATYEQFSAIAPTVVKNETNMDDWREYIRFYGEALNVIDETEALLEVYEQRLATLNADTNGAFEGKTASLIQVNDPATLYLNFSSYRGWYPLSDVGFVGSEQQLDLMNTFAIDNTPSIQMSNEEVALLNTDYIILMNAAFDPENTQANIALYESYQTDPLWGALPAVQNGNFYLVDLAWQANGVISAHAVIDDMYRLFLNQEPTTVNPYTERIQLDTPPQTLAQTFAPVEGFPAFTPTPTLVEVVEDRGETLLVRHMMGETEVPANPQRIYTDASTTQITLSLGLPVVGAQYFTNLLDIPELELLLQDVTELGTNTYQANFEAILALQPDLIITWANVATNPDSQGVYEALSQIAPTIVLNGNPFTYWQQSTLVLGQLFGRESQAETLLTDYARRSLEQCERIRTVIGQETVTIVDVFDGAIRVIGVAAMTPDGSVIPPAFTSWAYIDCGLTPSAEVARLTNGGFSASVSLESLGELQSDHLIVYTNVASPDADEVYQRFTSSSLWELLPAVQKGQVYRVSVLDASGYYSALYVLTQVADVVAGS